MPAAIPAAIRTAARRAGDGWVVSGRKVWTSHARHSAKILLLARTTPYEEAGPRKLDGLTLFVADLDPRAVTIREIDKLGRAAVDSNEVIIEGLRVDGRDVVGEVGRGFWHLLDALNPERVSWPPRRSGSAGLRWAGPPRTPGSGWSSTGPSARTRPSPIPWRAAWARLEAAFGLTLRAGWLFDQGQPCGAEANAAKFLAAEAGFEACDAALQTFGGFGYAKEFDVERLWREVRLYKLAPVSQQMALNYLAERVLGLPKSY